MFVSKRKKMRPEKKTYLWPKRQHRRHLGLFFIPFSSCRGLNIVVVVVLHLPSLPLVSHPYPSPRPLRSTLRAGARSGGGGGVSSSSSPRHPVPSSPLAPALPHASSCSQWQVRVLGHGFVVCCRVGPVPSALVSWFCRRRRLRPIVSLEYHIYNLYLMKRSIS